MQKFKHKTGDLIQTTAGTFGKVLSAKVVYEIAFGPEDIKLVDEECISTEPKQIRTRTKKVDAEVA